MVKKKEFKKRFEGIVARKIDRKTILVLVSRLKLHPLYKKQYRRDKKYKVHTEKDLALGSKVTIEETRPQSKEKRWQVV